MITQIQPFKVTAFTGTLDRTRFHEIQQTIVALEIQLGDVALVDLTHVNFMDSSGLSALIMALKEVRAAGGDLCICAPQPQVQILLDLLSMEQVFKIFPDRQAFSDFRASYAKLTTIQPLFVKA
jgi:anti-sigma B factor antagonist